MDVCQEAVNATVLLEARHALLTVCLLTQWQDIIAALLKRLERTFGYRGHLFDMLCVFAACGLILDMFVPLYATMNMCH
eukprot:979529-Amphidinium_carterae.1